MAVETPGSEAGPYPSRFYIFVQHRTSSQNETAGYVQRRVGVYVKPGSAFGGTVLQYGYGSGTRLYGEGVYADSGWYDVGWVSYGSSTSYSNYSAYTGYSSGYHESSVSARYSPDVPKWAAKPVTNISVARSGASNIVKWTRNPTAARPYERLYIERKVGSGGWGALATLGAGETSYTDKATSPNTTYQYRVRAYNSSGYSAYATTGASAIPPNAPSAPTGATAARNGDSKNTVSWTNKATTAAPYDNLYLERSVNGGSWTALATLGGGATSYADATTGANSYYRYRVRAKNSSAYSEYATTAITYNTPAAPDKIAVSRSGETTVRIDMVNTARTATGLELQRSKDRTNWATVKTLSGLVTTTTDDPGGGTFYYRARNTRGSLASGYVVSGAVTTICAPAKPTLVAPVAGVAVPKSNERIAITWQHVPIDGSAQTAAEVAYSTNGGSAWTTVAVPGSAALLELANSFSVNTTVTWKVRTKGVHADFSPWSDTRVFYVYQVPTLTIESPKNGSVVEQIPVRIGLAYSDPSGSLAEVVIEVAKDGRPILNKQIGANLLTELSVAEFMPENGGVYTVTATARSTSTLTAKSSVTVSVDFALPYAPWVWVRPEEDSGQALIDVGFTEAEHRAKVAQMLLYRIADGHQVLLSDSLTEGSTFADENAPLNIEYQYKVVTVAFSGVVSEEVEEGSVKSPFAFFYFDGDAAKAKLNPVGEKSIVRSERKLVTYWGRKYPVAYDSQAVSETQKYKAMLKTRDEGMAFRRLIEAGGSCVYKSLDGDVFHAVADVKITPAHTAVGYYGEVSVDVTRVDGGDL
ncbi:MAG: fibronectin type III domain-containing protein [Gordonibacter sp.]|uniref:fibronectin type III domain-containing protein n=1 Tax=Gordonibacter sp. TaxID=1968902 RepID=UPI002FCC4744